MVLRHFLLSLKMKELGPLDPLPTMELTPPPEAWLPDSGIERVIPGALYPKERRAIEELFSLLESGKIEEPGFVFWISADVRVRVNRRSLLSFDIQLEARILDGTDMFIEQAVPRSSVFAVIENLLRQLLEKALAEGGKLMTHGREVSPESKTIN